MKRVLSLALAAALVVPFMAQAQAKPNFSGTWTLDQAKSDPPPQRGGGGGGGGGRGGGGGGGGRGGGGPITIVQSAADIKIGEATYKLDGSESVNQMQGRGGPQEVKSKARWEGNTIVIESTRDMGGMSITTKEVRSLSADGKEMTVQTTNQTPQGEMTRKTVFTKS
jgi:hypothetical protein